MPFQPLKTHPLSFHTIKQSSGQYDEEINDGTLVESVFVRNAHAHRLL